MSHEIPKITCVRCGAYLFDEDDVVYCPICGAPHHRDCFNALGHCALEEYHGTENEYRKPSADEYNKKTQSAEENIDSSQYVICEMCGEKYNKDFPKCPKCSAPNFKRVNMFNGFDLLGGVPSDYKLDDDVTADEAKRFVISNTHRYIPKFATLSKKHKVSWNWMAFFFPCQWLLSRKMFKGGIVAGVLSVVTSLFLFPLNKVLYSLGAGEGLSYTQLANEMMDSLPKIGIAVLILAFAGFLFDLGLRLFFGLFGDYFYKKHSLSVIKDIKANSSDIAADYRKKGGVNILFFFIGVLALQYIPSIIEVLFLQ